MGVILEYEEIFKLRLAIELLNKSLYKSSYLQWFVVNDSKIMRQRTRHY